LRGCEQAQRNLEQECGPAQPAFDAVLSRTRARWGEHLGRVQVEGGTPARRTVLATALYHSLIKPCFADDESPFWPASGPYAFDVCTMWDMYKTQLPLLAVVAPAQARALLDARSAVWWQRGRAR